MDTFQDDEDVPPDFFDDFLSTDFMDGLDVVDTWDDDHNQNNKTEEKPRNQSRRSLSKPRKRRHSRSRSLVRRKSREYKDRSPKSARLKKRGSRDRSNRDRSRKRNSKLKAKSQDELNLDHRRDPEKTKRDIQKDKDKCAKDQEEKIISQKLMVVETGLVPPGTEMDTDLEIIAPDSKKLPETNRSASSSRQNTSDKHVKPKRQRSVDNKRSSRRSRSPRQQWSGSRSLKYSRRGSHEMKRYPERRAKISPRPQPRRTSLSKDKLKSPASDRETWLSHRDKRVTAADFFDSPGVRRDRGLIAGTNEYYNSNQHPMNQPTQQYMAAVPAPMPVPAPVPVPEQFFPITSEPNYDQSFFIGNQFPGVYPNPAPYQVPVNNSYQDSLSYQTSNSDVNYLPNVVTVPIVESNFQTTPSFIKNVDTPKLDAKKEQDTINKLFEDKQISLSDFLSASANYADCSKPINLQKKIKVISLCQDAITSMSSKSTLKGRFFLRKVISGAEKVQESKYQSPLRKTPFVRFTFTTATKSAEKESALQRALNTLLASLGLLEDPINPKLGKISHENISSPVPVPMPVPVPAPITKRQLNVKGGDSVSMIAPRKAKMCQTDSARCEICELRKTRKFIDRGVQSEARIKSNVATQVTEDDFIRLGPKPQFRDGLKNQSIAHLTPAQLMRQTLNQPESNQPNNYMTTRGLSNAPADSPNSYHEDNLMTDFQRTNIPSNNFNTSPFKTRGNNSFEMQQSFPITRPNMYGNRNFQNANINNAPSWENQRAPNSSDGGRQNYGFNQGHSMQQHQPNKRTLLPNPPFKNNF